MGWRGGRARGQIQAQARKPSPQSHPGRGDWFCVACLRCAFSVPSLCLHSRLLHRGLYLGTGVRLGRLPPVLALTRRNPPVPCRCDKRDRRLFFFGNWLRGVSDETSN